MHYADESSACFVLFRSLKEDDFAGSLTYAPSCLRCCPKKKLKEATRSVYESKDILFGFLLDMVRSMLPFASLFSLTTS